MNITLEEVLFKEAFIIAKAAKQLDKKLYNVVDLIVKNIDSNLHVIITGVGKNSDISKKIAATYSSIGIPSIYLDSYNALHGDLGCIIKNQVIIGLSKSGETFELLKTFEACGEKGCKLVSITCKEESSLGKIAEKYSGHNIVVSCEFEADKNNLAPTCSSTLLLALGDAIGIVCSERIGLTKEKFLENHPAGSLGKQLKNELGK